MNYSHKTEFKGTPVVHESEYKVKYEKDGKMLSFLGAEKKMELEMEYLLKKFENEDYLKILSKTTFESKLGKEA